MVYALSLLALLYGVWLILSGHYTPLLLTLGVVSSGLIVWVAGRMRILDDEGVPLGMALRFLAYLPWLVLETIRSNIAVARVILSPSLPISPWLYRFTGRPKTDLGRFLYGNSITFTPGTTTCGIEDGEFTVYALTRDFVDISEENEMVRRVCWVEGSE
jgi:multicomponent Na+:H+ antiporter subunit E